MAINPVNLTTASSLPAAVAVTTTTTQPATAATPQALRVTTGDVSQIQTGVIVAASVVRTNARESVLDIGGRSFTVEAPFTLLAGDVLSVRVNGGKQPPTLDLLGPPVRQVVRSDTPPLPTTSAQASIIDVLSQEAGGQVRVTIDGEPAIATSDQPLAPGGRYVAQVERGPNAIVIRLLPESPQLPTTVATAILRATPPTQFGDTIQPLLQELELAITNTVAPHATKLELPSGALQRSAVQARYDVPPPTEPATTTAGVASHAAVTNPTVRAAAIEVRTALQSVLPPPGEPPSAEVIHALVQDGGQQYEAKLTHLTKQAIATHQKSVEVNTTPDTSQPSEPKSETVNRADNGTSVRNDPAARREPSDSIQPKHDLKGGLLNLLRAVSNLSAEFPVAGTMLNGIERQQAVNVMAAQDGGPFVIQVPFPDGQQWRTASMGVEPDRSGTRDESGRPSAFRVMMHVPLSELGDTWIDAGADGPRLRATLFLTDAHARDRVRPELADLRQELQAAGFTDVLLDVRTAAQLTDQQRRKVNAIRSVAPESGGLLDVRA